VISRELVIIKGGRQQRFANSFIESSVRVGLGSRDNWRNGRLGSPIDFTRYEFGHRLGTIPKNIRLKTRNIANRSHIQ